MFSNLEIRYKIILPVTLLFVVAIAVTAFVSVSLLSRSLDRRFQRQVEYVSEMVAETDFALNPSILEKLKPMVGADIVTFDERGQVLAGTLPAETEVRWLESLRSTAVFDRVFGGGVEPVIRDLELSGRPYRVAYRPVRGTPRALVAFLVDTSEIERAKVSVGKPVALVAVVMIVLATSISLLVARSITSPLQRLVEQTRQLTAGERDVHAEVTGTDEVGRLAVAFNTMSHQLRLFEEKLLRSEKLAVTGQLAARVAHDIRNPLSSIKMQAQLLRGKLSAESGGRDSLSAILKEIDRVEWVVQGLLDLARPIELKLARADVNAVVQDVLSATAPQLEHSKIAVRAGLDPEVEPVLLDSSRLKQALRNVIANAMEAMPGGGVLEANTRSDEDGKDVILEISDDGVGIDARARDRLFDPFFTTKREGVGLGLVNTASIVKEHGGTIELLPREGAGTRVVIRLPVAPAPAS